MATTDDHFERACQLAYVTIRLQNRLSFLDFGRVCDHLSGDAYWMGINTLVGQLIAKQVPVHDDERAIIDTCRNHFLGPLAADHALDHLTMCTPGDRHQRCPQHRLNHHEDE